MLLLKVENFELQNFFPTENFSANHILQNFLSAENFPAWEWALKVVSHFNHIVMYGNISSCAEVISSVLMLRGRLYKTLNHFCNHHSVAKQRSTLKYALLIG
jgi:hypothetical protein